MKSLRHIKFLGIPFNFGQDLSGVRDAPDALRRFGAFARLNRIAPVIDLGDLDFSSCVGYGAHWRIKREREADLGNELIGQFIENEDLKDSFLLNVGGDHGMGLGAIQGVLGHYPETVVVWADAHGDINSPESSPSGNFHGMPLWFLLNSNGDTGNFVWAKRRLAPHRLILMGPRELDAGEKKIIRELNIQYFSSDEMNYFGAERLLSSALCKADPEGVCPIHLSFDVDLFDSSDIISTGTRVNKGPKVEEVFSVGRYLGKTGRLRSMDLVEVNPHIGDEDEVMETLQLSLEFLEITLGEVFGSYAISSSNGQNMVFNGLAL